MGKILQEPGKVTFAQAIKDFFRGYVDFKGRTTRAGYWWVYLILYLINFIMTITVYAVLFITFFSFVSKVQYLNYVDSDYVFSMLGQYFVGYIVLFGVFLLYSLAMCLPTLALSVRRYRDVGLRGRGTLVTILVYFVLVTLVVLFPFPPLVYLVAQFGIFFFVMSVLPTDELTITSENKILTFFFRKKSEPETPSTSTMENAEHLDF